MNHHPRSGTVGTLVTSTQSTTTSSQDREEMRKLAAEIAADMKRQLASALEDVLMPAAERAALAEKRKVVAEKFGKVIADALNPKALIALYQQIPGAGSPAPNSLQGDPVSSGGCFVLRADVSDLPKE